MINKNISEKPAVFSTKPIAEFLIKDVTKIMSQTDSLSNAAKEWLQQTAEANVFGAIMAFLYADFNVSPAVKINANFYGWPFAIYIAVITAVSAILIGISVNILFSLFGILPTEIKKISELTTFQFNYTSG